MRNVTEIQQRLIKLGYLAAGEADGKFGPKSLDAYNHWRASKGAGPVNAASLTQLNIDLFPEEQPGAKPRLTPNPVVQAIGWFALKVFLHRLFPGKEILMDSIVTTVKSAWASKLNWTMAVGVLFNIFMLLGHPVPDDVQAAVLTAGNSLVLVVGWVIRTWFTTSITTAAVAKLTSK